MLTVTQPGLQSTLQGAPRVGGRHLGIPYAGPADDLSMALANRLVGNRADDTFIEITYGGFEADVVEACAVAVTGAAETIRISGASAPMHETLRLRAGDVIKIDPPQHGMRAYLAIHSGFVADAFYGSTSTYLPAALGGLEGRTLRAGDHLRPNQAGGPSADLKTPNELCPVFSDAFALRVCESAEFEYLEKADRTRLFSSAFTIGRQATRMGVTLEGHALSVDSDNMMKSAPVFPGTIQCPPSGVPVVLLSDAQTTGGYPRIASVARCDRHLLGQLRPGNAVQLLRRSPEQASLDWAQKRALFEAWLH